MLSVKQEMYLSQGWEGRRGIFLNLCKRAREGLSVDWAFRLRPERPEGGNNMKNGGREIQTEGTEWSKAWGREELGVPEELKGGHCGREIVGINQALLLRVPYVDDDTKDEPSE